MLVRLLLILILFPAELWLLNLLIYYFWLGGQNSDLHSQYVVCFWVTFSVMIMIALAQIYLGLGIIKIILKKKSGD